MGDFSGPIVLNGGDGTTNGRLPAIIRSTNAIDEMIYPRGHMPSQNFGTAGYGQPIRPPPCFAQYAHMNNVWADPAMTNVRLEFDSKLSQPSKHLEQQTAKHIEQRIKEWFEGYCAPWIEAQRNLEGAEASRAELLQQLVGSKKECDRLKLDVKHRDVKILALEEVVEEKAKKGREDEKMIMDSEVRPEISKEKAAVFTKKIAEPEAKAKEQDDKKTTKVAKFQTTVED